MVEKIKVLFTTSRPVSWVNTAYPFAAGYLLITHEVDTIFVIGSLFFLIPYNYLMYGINDVFDYESDIANPRKGGVEGAKLPKDIHQFVVMSSSLLALPFVLYLLSVSTSLGKVVLLLLMFLVVAYSAPKLRFKERPFLDSVTSSCHFVGPLIYACTFGSFSRTSLIIIISFFLWGMASHAFGAVQDIIYDKQAGIGSVATVIGAKQTVRFAIGLYAASMLLLLSLGSLGLIGLLNLLYIANVWSYRNIGAKKAHTTNIAWRRFIKLNLLSGFIVTMIIIVYLR